MAFRQESCWHERLAGHDEILDFGTKSTTLGGGCGRTKEIDEASDTCQHSSTPYMETAQGKAPTTEHTWHPKELKGQAMLYDRSVLPDLSSDAGCIYLI
ncbi:hypothetical protein PG995_004669 [Apiospora arundinis]